ncbi:hypothetical protein MFIFM68171_03759 [Madurella fahalii]|uniref:Uncharacterized protein n=1 Tax=Madurella fahalii TaxID=1157608 RepID=A0ABQ0G707_9PEZI
MNRRIECRSEGCTNEVLYKTLDGAFVDPHDRRASSGRPPISPTGRGSPSGHHRYSNGSIQVSPFCKQHTCIHFHGDERCVYQKPRHDTVCAVHARCPIPNCNQARAQFLDPTYDPLSNAIPRYARYDVCPDHKCAVPRCPGRRASPRSNFCQAHSCQAEGCMNTRQDQRNCCEEHQCKARGCRTIVEGRFPYCVIHIKCGMDGCGEARHFSAETKEYLAHCTNHSTCSARFSLSCTAIKMERSAFCEEHTCRERDCERYTTSPPYCTLHGCGSPGCRSHRSDGGKFCPLHTCRAEKCREHVDRLALFCKTHGCSKSKCHQIATAEQMCLDHLKAYYIAQGKRQVHGTRQKMARAGPRQRHDDSDDDKHEQNSSRKGSGQDNRHEMESDSSDEESPKKRGGEKPPDGLTAIRGQPSYKAPSPPMEYLGTPPNNDGGGDEGEPFIKLPQREGDGSAGRPFQGRQPEDDGW